MSTSESGTNEYASQCRYARLRDGTISTASTSHDVRNLSVSASATRLVFPVYEKYATSNRGFRRRLGSLRSSLWSVNNSSSAEDGPQGCEHPESS
jgi:hypothetical protein